MALVVEMNVGGRSVVSYNLHLESRGDDRLPCAQLGEYIDAARRYNPSMPLILAGDFNMDLPRTAPAGALMQYRFQSAFSTQPDRTTAGSFFERGRPIDWIFLRGSVRSDRACVHTSISASDHFPLAAQMAFT